MKFKLYSFKNRCYYAGSIILTVQLFALKLSIELSDKGELTYGWGIHVQVKDWITNLRFLDFDVLWLFHIVLCGDANMPKSVRNVCLFARFKADSQ